ncbi:MAG: ATP-binding cassette domain-containing protein, partial [Bacilli bacterium]
MLKVSNLKKNYHDSKNEVYAIEDVSFTLNEEEFISIVGPSGCGKSTILSILANVETKSGGIIDNDKTIGYMLQSDLLFDWLTIVDNCLIGLKMQNKINKYSKKYVNSLLEKYGLYDFKDMYPSSLSGGMRQRVALIRTLALNPDVLLLDEPFSALDYQTRIAVSDDVYRILKEENKSAIMVTHDISEAVSMADKVLILSNIPS